VLRHYFKRLFAFLYRNIKETVTALRLCNFNIPPFLNAVEPVKTKINVKAFKDSARTDQVTL
jgi:hypothetical protein